MKHFLLFFLLLQSFLLSAQGIIVPEPPVLPPERPPVISRAGLKAHSLRADVQIIGMQAVTHLVQEFENPTDLSIEGHYLLPLPKGRVITDFSMKINGQKVKGELLDAKKARELYEDILRKYRDPALLEYLGHGLLKLSIFPIPPRGRQQIEITYAHEMLPSQTGVMEYRLPLSARPGMSLEDLVVSVQVETQRPIQNIYSPTHPLEVKRISDKACKGSLEMSKTPLKGPFVLYVFLGEEAVGAHLFPWKEKGEAGYFLLSLNPAFEKTKPLPKDVVFLLDASGSMRDGKMEQARQGLQLCIDQLGAQDRFEIIRFSTEANAFFDELVPADAAHLAKAKQYISKLEAMGGTNMEEALQKALALAPASAKMHRPLYVVLITDGKPTIGETHEERLVEKVLEKNDLHTRIFTVGIGYALNARLLDRLTAATRAFRTYVYEGEKLDFKLQDFMRKVSAPVLTGLSWEVEGAVSLTDVYPRTLPDMFRGNSLILTGRYTGHGKAKLRLKGSRNGKARVYEFELNFPEASGQYEFVPALWASRAVGYLLEQIRLHGEDEELIGEVVRLAKKHGIITPYTSYLILEDETYIGFDERRQGHRFMHQQLEIAEDYSPKLESEAYRYRMKQSMGQGSVEASDELQQLQQADNLAKAEVGRDRLSYKSKYDGRFNLADEYLRVQGRAFYHTGDWWIDALVLDLDPAVVKPVKKVFLYSREFLDLVEAHPEYALLWALNQNVRMMLDGELIEIEHPYE